MTIVMVKLTIKPCVHPRMISVTRVNVGQFVRVVSAQIVLCSAMLSAFVFLRVWVSNVHLAKIAMRSRMSASIRVRACRRVPGVSVAGKDNVYPTIV